MLVYFCWNSSSRIPIPGWFQSFLLVFYILTACVLILHASHFFHIQAWVELSFGNQVCDCFLLQILGLKRNLIVLLLLLGCAWLVWVFRPVTYVSVIFFAATLSFIITAIFMPLFDRYLIIHPQEWFIR